MRLALNISELTEDTLVLHFLRADVLTNEGLDAGGIIQATFIRESHHKPWGTPLYSCDDLGGNGPDILASLALDYIDAATTPLELARAILIAHGAQVVWDEALKRWRNCSTAKDAKPVWELIGRSLTVEVEAEEAAKSMARRLMATALAADTCTDAEMAAWLKWKKEGCTVKKLSGGAVPTHYLIEALANPDQRAHAKDPIFVPPRKGGRPAGAANKDK